MINEPQGFLIQLASMADSLKDCQKLCRNLRSTGNSEARVLSTCLFEVFREIEEYLNYFKAELESKFGFKHAEEWSRIHEAVLKGFVAGVKRERGAETVEMRTELVSEIILAWDRFPKETEEALLSQIDVIRTNI